MLHALSRFTLLVPRSKCTSFTIPLYPLLQPRLFASHPQSQELSSKDITTNRRKRLRINWFILCFSRLLKQEKNDDAVIFFKNHVSKIPGNRNYRFHTYEDGITTFLKHKLYKNAVEFYQQMFAEGMRASSGLRAMMLVCSDIVTAPHEQRRELEPLYEKLSRILCLSSYSESHLCDLLDVMRGHPLIDSQFVSQLVDVFVKSRGSEYKLKSLIINKLIRFYAHVGGMDTAESLALPSRESADNHPRHTKPVPHTTLMSELTNKDALSSRHLSLIMDEMKQSHLPADLPFMNALVRSAVRLGNIHQAFSFYGAILKDPAPHMIPDSYTFGSLFNALQRLRARSANLRRARQLPNAPTPRQLFRQMLECHVIAVQTSAAEAKENNPRSKPPVVPVIVRVSTLNVALRQFMLSMDYPSAFVALQAFRALGLRPDTRSYRIVLTILLTQLRASLLSRPRYLRWATNFLGGGEGEVRMGDQPEDIRPVAQALLEFATGGGDAKFRAPALAVILREEEGRVHWKWDIEPLERLLMKAILANMALKGVSEGQVEHAFREKLAPYFYEMVPDRLWRGRRLRRATY